MSVDKNKAKARVVLTTGEHVNYFATMQEAEADVLRANKAAEDMGITARYRAEEYPAQPAEDS